ENALAFSLHFDPTQWRFRTASTGIDANEALLNLNTNQASHGRLGLALALPAGRAFAYGTRQVVIFAFSPLSDRSPDQLTIGFGDGPITREVMTATARSLPASFTVGAGLIEAHPLENVSAASFSETALASEAI